MNHPPPESDPRNAPPPHDDPRRRHTTFRAAVQTARYHARHRGRGTRTLTFMRELAREVSLQSTNRVRVAVGAMAIVMVLLIGALVWLFITTTGQQQTIAKQSKTIQKQSEELADERRRTAEMMKTIRAELEASYLREAAARARLEAFVSGEMEELRRRPVPLAARFREFHRDVRRSVFMIVTVAIARDVDRLVEVPLVGTGTAWLISDRGHLVTNKHVLKPWIFDLAPALANQGLSIAEEDVTWMAFPVDHKITWELRRTWISQDLTIDRADSFNTEDGTLQWVGAAPDVMEPPEAAEGVVQEHASNTPNDLALLRITAPGVEHHPLVCHDESATTWRPEQLTMVMAVGFPAGFMVLEGERETLGEHHERVTATVDTSPTLGEVRKIQDSIQVSCPIIPGNSGGPVLAFDPVRDQPVVIGVATSIARGEATHGLCIKVEHAMALMRAHDAD